MSRLFPIAALAVLVALLMTACGRKETPAPAPPSPPEPSVDALRMEDATVRNDGVLCTKATGQPFTGTLHEHWPSGKLRRETAMKEGQRHGLMKVWYENGQVETTGQFVMGQPVDVFIKISKNGLEETRTTFEKIISPLNTSGLSKLSLVSSARKLTT